MIIGIDGNEANVRNRVGSNVYAFELLWGIHKIIQNSKCKIKKSDSFGMDKVKLKIYLKDKPLDDLPKENQWWGYKVLKPKIWWTQWRLPLDLCLSLEKPDLFFTPGHYAPRFCPCPTVISIMDLAFLRFPEQFKKKDLWQLVNWTKYSVKKAAHIFTISEFTKKEIIHFYHYPEEKITVTYPGINKFKITIKNLKLKNPYFLYIGTLQPRKNLIRLINAFNLTIKQLNNETINLVIAGKKGWLYEEIFRKVEELRMRDRVIFTDFITEEEKTLLLKNAVALVLPSLYEGFGIPVLEAMAAGCPTLISRNSSLPEAGGKAVVYIEDPYKVDSIQKGLLKMLELNRQDKEILIKEGYQQIKKFRWENCAQKTLEVLWSLLEIKPEKN